MKKKILGIALIAISFVAFNGMAQSATCSNNENNVCNKINTNKRNAKANPYEGLTLTEAQQTQLMQLDAKCKAECKQKAESRKEKKNMEKTDRIAEKRASKKEYLKNVKAIIGPEQYIVFLENMFVNSPAQGRGKHMKQGVKCGKQELGKKDKRGHNRHHSSKQKPGMKENKQNS